MFYARYGSPVLRKNLEGAKSGYFIYRWKYPATSRSGTGRPCSQKKKLIIFNKKDRLRVSA